MTAAIVRGHGRNLQKIKVIPGELSRIVKEAETALQNTGNVYQRAGQLVRVVHIDGELAVNGIKRSPGSCIIQPITRDYLTLELSRAAKWTKSVDGGGARSIDPPSNVATALMSAVGEWPFPRLAGIVSAPTLRCDGSLLSMPGYDPVSGLFAAFDAAAFPPIVEHPALADAQHAIKVLRDFFSEVAFVGGRHSAHASVAISALLTAVVRHAIPIAPAFGISAHKQGSGKTTLARAVAYVALGRDPPALSLSDSEVEVRKSILATLIAGDPCVLIDNVACPVDSASLCAALTSTTYSDRLLGVSANITVPTTSTWIFTGNHLEFVGDLTSRAMLSVLDPEVERPESRVFQRDIIEYAGAHRGELVAAALTISRAYVASGCPTVDAKRSRYRDWDRLVRDPLIWLGCADPLDTQDELRAADTARNDFVDVLQAWREVLNDESATVNDVIKLAGKTSSGGERLREALRVVAGDRDGTINSRSLGRYLAKKVRRIEDGLRLEAAGESKRTVRPLYRVISVSSVIGKSSL